MSVLNLKGAQLYVNETVVWRQCESKEHSFLLIPALRLRFSLLVETPLWHVLVKEPVRFASKPVFFVVL